MIKNFPVVALIGARQVGKTTLLKELFPDSPFFDLEKNSDFELIAPDVEFFLNSFREKKSPLIFDEAQLLPPLFSALRVYVDQKRHAKGQVVLSGSSSPTLLNQISESLAGRVAIIEIPPLSMEEIEGKKSNESNFTKLLSDKKARTENFLSLNAHSRSWIDRVWWGGYPEVVAKQDLFFKRIWSDQYLQTYIDRDIRSLFPDLNMEIYRRFIGLLAQTSGEVINQAQWASALGVSEPTVKKYLDIAQGTFLFRKLPVLAHHPQKKLLKSPKGLLKDTGLCCALLKINTPEDLFSHPRSGLLFETYCIENIIKNLNQSMSSFDICYFRTRDHAEIDLILDFSDRKIPIEIKLGTSVKNESLKTLKEFVKQFECPYGFVINNGEAPRFLADKIIQMPFGYL